MPDKMREYENQEMESNESPVPLSLIHISEPTRRS